MTGNNKSEFDHYHINVAENNESGMRLDKYLATKIEETSRTKIKAAINDGTVSVNGKNNPKPSYNIEPGDAIEVRIPNPKPPEVKAEDLPLDIVYEDEHLLIVNKDANMVVHPAPGNWTGTLVNALMYHTNKLSNADSDTVRPGIVHRLDKNTTGLLVVAKDEPTHRTLSKYFRTKDIERTYQAIVWGRPDKEEGTIRGNIGRNPHNRKQMAVVSDDKGKHAQTHYRAVEYFDHLTLLELTLETGRTHQIRVHLAHENMWVFGDPKYGGDAVRYGSNTGSRKQMFNNLFANFRRPCLHAKSLGFQHPATGEEMQFDSDLPADFQQVLAKLRQNCQPKNLYS